MKDLDFFFFFDFTLAAELRPLDKLMLGEETQRHSYTYPQEPQSVEMYYLPYQINVQRLNVTQ